MRGSPRLNIASACSVTSYPFRPSQTRARSTPFFFKRVTAMRVDSDGMPTACINPTKSAIATHPPRSRTYAPRTVRISDVALPGRESKSSRIALAGSGSEFITDRQYSGAHLGEARAQRAEAETQPVGGTKVGDDALAPQL